MAEWSLPREDLAARAARVPTVGLEDPAPRAREEFEVFRPRPHERAQSRSGRARRALRRFADLQFSSICHDLMALLPQVEGTLADVGCGAQPFRDMLLPGVRYIPVDIQDSERHFGYHLTEVRRFRGSMLPLADAEVSAVLCAETLEHVKDAPRFLAELARALEPGGRLILTIPFAARWHYVPLDFRRYTPSGLKEELEAAGFHDVQIYARGGALAVAAYKALGVVLALWLGYGARGARALAARALALFLAPLALMAALLGHLGLVFPGPVEDTLGYTVLAHKAEG
jgi:SAM-dependent methyltransferase